MTRVRILPGVLVASALIGPAVAVGLIVGATLLSRGDEGTMWAALPLIAFFAVPIGFVVSVVPNLLGTALLAWAGQENVAVRLPVLWAVVGAGVAGGGAAVLATSGERTSVAALFAAMGAVSALLCRWKIRWTDDATIKEACHEGVRPHPARAVARPRRHAADRWLD